MLLSVVNELLQQTNNMSSRWQQAVGGQAEAERWNSVGKMAALHRKGGWRGCRATCPTINKGLHSTADAGREQLVGFVVPNAILLSSVGEVFATARNRRDGGHDELEGDVCHD